MFSLPLYLIEFRLYPPKNRTNRNVFHLKHSPSIQRDQREREKEEKDFHNSHLQHCPPFLSLSILDPSSTLLYSLSRWSTSTRVPFRAVVNYLRDEDASDVALLSVYMCVCVCVAWRTRYPADVAVATAATGPLIAAFDAVTNEGGTRKSGEDKWKSRRETILG